MKNNDNYSYNNESDDEFVYDINEGEEEESDSSVQLENEVLLFQKIIIISQTIH